MIFRFALAGRPLLLLCKLVHPLLVRFLDHEEAVPKGTRNTYNRGGKALKINERFNAIEKCIALWCHGAETIAKFGRRGWHNLALFELLLS